MKKFLALFAAAMAITTICDIQAASAQRYYQDGYFFGSGLRFGRGFGIGGGISRGGFEEPPYFAKFPPVYYSHPVARPYGISPYAVPPGVMPVEMTVKPEPQKLVNPFYQPQQQPGPAVPPAVPPKDSSPAENENKDSLEAPAKPDVKSAGLKQQKRIFNPFYSNFAAK